MYYSKFLLSEKDNNVLRLKYNPDKSKLRNDQLRLLSMLSIIDGICKEHNIPYWLSSGTLLGCARHGGFIPWDDDMDIFMLKNDYKKLLKILLGYNSTEFVFHCKETDTDYVNVFGKFRDKNGKIESKSPRYKYYKYAGIGLDIFPIEKTNYYSAFLSGKIYNTLMKSTVYISNRFFRHTYTRFLEFILLDLFCPILRIVGLINPNNEYHLVLGTGFPKQRVFLKDVFPLDTALFEGQVFPVPHNVDGYLKNLYGDWKTVPSQSEIMSSIHNQEYRKEILNNI